MFNITADQRSALELCTETNSSVEQSEKREEFQLALFTKFVTFDNPAVVRRSNDLLSQGNQFLIDYMFVFAATLLITKINSRYHLLGWYWPRKKALAMDKREIKKSFVPGSIVSECGVHIVDDHNYFCATSDWKQMCECHGTSVIEIKYSFSHIESTIDQAILKESKKFGIWIWWW